MYLLFRNAVYVLNRFYLKHLDITSASYVKEQHFQNEQHQNGYVFRHNRMEMSIYRNRKEQLEKKE